MIQILILGRNDKCARDRWLVLRNSGKHYLIGCCSNRHRDSIFITKGESQPHILLLMLEGECRWVAAFDHRRAFELEHGISNCAQILPE